MNVQKLREIIREELDKAFQEMQPPSLDEKSVPPPYDRKKKRSMKPHQVSSRKKIGDAMLKNPKAVAHYKKKFGDDWKDYIWATASSKALKKGG
jgi:hypothetical protein